VLGCEPVFADARVQAKSLFDHLKAGDSIEQFLEGFRRCVYSLVISLTTQGMERGCETKGVPLGSVVLPLKNAGNTVRSMPTE
jgi:hypothetical protein